MTRYLWLIFSLLTCLAAHAEDSPVTIVPDVVYGHKDGLALTFDVFTPREKPNGLGVIFVVSGGWYSNWSPPEKMRGFFEPVTRHGYTVFAVRHGSSPKYGIPDAVADIRRGVRFIRMHATDYHIDPARLGIYGMSAGGHLSLVLATTGDDGNPQAEDQVDRVSDRVQAVIAFVPPTDLTIMIKEAADRLPAYNNIPALDLDLANAQKLSPLLHVSADDAPILLLSGAKDDLVPIDHSRKLDAELEKQHVTHKLVEFENAGHGFGSEDQKRAFQEMAEWLGSHLKPE